MWGANRIRYPGSPRRKRWALGVGDCFHGFRAVANALSAPPGSKVELTGKLKEIDGARTAVGLIRCNAKNLTWV